MSMLTVQYRMNNCIMGWSSKELYEERLVADTSVATHVLSDLPHWSPTGSGSGTGGDVGVLGLSGDSEALLAPMLLIDTAGCGLEEVQVSVW